MRIRNWPIRAKIIVLVVPPLVSLLVLWIFATSVMLTPALNLLDVRTNSQESGRPAATLITELQKERRASLVFIGGGRADVKALTDQRTRTDAAASTFRNRATGDKEQSAANDLTKQRIRETVAAIDRLVDGRKNIDSGALDRAAALELYSSVIDSSYRLFGSLSSEESLQRATRNLISLGRGSELMSQEDALVSGVAAAGKFAIGEPARLSAMIGAQRYVFADVAPELAAGIRPGHDQMVKGEAFIRLRALEDKLVSDSKVGAALPIDPALWRSALDASEQQLRDFTLSAGDELVKRATPLATGILVRLGLAAVLGLLALLVSVALTVRVGRSLIRRITGLRQSAQELADERLPSVVARLRQGEELEVATESPELEFGSDEIGELGKTFNAVQRTAIESAVQEAQLRRGLNEVFLNIARRSQTLLHRQLALLDRMERRSTDPEELENLFRVDHLATRMRRHAEDLVILAGAAPGRGWRNPVPMVDVIRGAVSEVEDYARVGFLAIPQASLVGRAVADVIHLLAELIENATAYSPPHTRVQIGGMLVPNGFAIEIEDRGLGMAPEDIQAANERLLHPPDFDPANSARLGLFVVALLAARHGIRVTLRSSPYGGITTVVLVPPALISGAETPAVLLEPFAPALALGPAEVMRTSRTEEPEESIQPEPPATEAPEPEAPPVPVAAAAPVQLAERQTEDPPGPRSTARPIGDKTIDLTDDGLPRRRRQASLAPQLRDGDDSDDGVDEPVPVGGARSPEQIRDMMSSFQAGLVRGRRDAATAGNTASPAHEEGST